MKKPNTLDNSIAYIEKQLFNDISVSDIAKQSFFSKTHYQRLFRSVVGEPVMEYVKNRRLQQAGQDVLKGNMSIVDIAMKYGYDSHEGFTRAFKAYFGVSPSHYRKRGKSNKTEVIKMLSNDVVRRIGKNAELIYATLNNFVDEAKMLSAKSLANNTKHGTGTAIVAKELHNLAERTTTIINDNVNGLLVSSVSDFEMADKIFCLSQFIDDITFQMNLLRFFSGIETGRINLADKDEFDAIDEAYATLCNQIIVKKETMLTLIHEAVELIYADINQEAANCIASAVNEINSAITDGKNTTSALHSAAKSLCENGGVFAYIAKMTDETIDILNNAAGAIKNNKDTSSTLSSLKDISFSMNISAFNVNIETARAENAPICVDAADKLMKYAWVLHSTQQKCTTLTDEYKRLMALTKPSTNESTESIKTKQTDDLIFQSEILSSQFTIEAERINQEPFRNLAQTLKLSHNQLVKSRDVNECCKTLNVILNNLNKMVSEAGVQAGSFAYFAKEYENFIGRLCYSKIS